MVKNSETFLQSVIIRLQKAIHVSHTYCTYNLLIKARELKNEEMTAGATVQAAFISKLSYKKIPSLKGLVVTLSYKWQIARVEKTWILLSSN